MPVGVVFTIGLFARLVLLPSLPILEDDSYRYFYDGALVSAGLNPYAHPPNEVFDQQSLPNAEILGLPAITKPANPDLQFLQDEPYVKRIAYPHLSSIYPPTAQAAFWGAAQIAPFNMQAWRLVLLLVDVLAFGLLVKLLAKLSIPTHFSLVYWLNPILLIYGHNAGHMDILLVPLLIGCALLIQQRRTALAGLCLALAVGVKIWPLVLAPFLFRQYLHSLAKLTLSALPFAVTSAVLLMPLWLAVGSGNSGVESYANSWRTNSFVFGLLEDGLFYLQAVGWLAVADPSAWSRAIVYSIVVLVILWRFRLPHTNTKSFILSSLWVSAALFLLAPTGYPWYFIWFLPFLAIRPFIPLLLLSLTLMLYPLRFWFNDLGYREYFDYGVVPLQFLPVLLLLLWGLRKPYTSWPKNDCGKV